MKQCSHGSANMQLKTETSVMAKFVTNVRHDDKPLPEVS